MNRDGRVDLIALASGMPELVWYENPGWQRHVIAGPFSNMINVAAEDLDGDGIPELALAYEFANVAKNSLGKLAMLRFARTGNGHRRTSIRSRHRTDCGGRTCSARAGKC